MSTKTKPSPYAEDVTTGEIFILRQPKYTGIPTLALLTMDGLPITRFPKDGRYYIKVENVIAWHEKEHRESGGKLGSPGIAAHFRDILAKVDAERAEKKGDVS